MMPHLHSQYNPEKEAERFAETLQMDFKPAVLVVTEPGESWLAPALRRRFPGTFLAAARYQDGLYAESDSTWDAVWRPGSGVSLQTFLLNHIPDELMSLAFFIPWKPADQVWPEMAESVWRGIADFIRMQKGVIQTRAHFGKKWLSNMIHNCICARTVTAESRTDKPVFLAAAGPSLEHNLPAKKNCFTVYAVSSAMECLVANNILPDLCFSTDGGYWAEKYLFGLPQSVPIALPLEAAAPSSVLDTNPVLFLSYGSSLERELFSLCGIQPAPAERNGTVSGTASRYALLHTGNKVYAAGLDLLNGTSFPHARPHLHDRDIESATSRVRPVASMLYERNSNDSALSIYASWFASRDADFTRRFVRLTPCVRNIAGIREAALSDVEKNLSVSSVQMPASPCAVPSKAIRRDAVVLWLENMKQTAASDGMIHTILSGSPTPFGEILQMISYMGYLDIIRKNALGDEKGLQEAERRLASAAVDDINLLIRKVTSYEL